MTELIGISAMTRMAGMTCMTSSISIQLNFYSHFYKIFTLYTVS